MNKGFYTCSSGYYFINPANTWVLIMISIYQLLSSDDMVFHLCILIHLYFYQEIIFICIQMLSTLGFKHHCCYLKVWWMLQNIIHWCLTKLIANICKYWIILCYKLLECWNHCVIVSALIIRVTCSWPVIVSENKR